MTANAFRSFSTMVAALFVSGMLMSAAVFTPLI